MAGPSMSLSLSLFCFCCFLLSSSDALSIPPNLETRVNSGLDNTNNVCKSQRGNPAIQNFSQWDLRKTFNNNVCNNPTDPDPKKRGSFQYYQYTDGDTSVTKKERDSTRPETNMKQPATTGAKCDHLVELNIMKRVLESPGGVCEQLASLYSSKVAANIAQADAARAAIEKSINTYANVVWADAILEDQKTLIVKYNFDHTQDLNSPAQDAATPVTQITAKRIQAAHQYLTDSRDKSVPAAAAMDAQIHTLFPHLTSTMHLATTWNQVLNTGSILATQYAALAAGPAAAPAGGHAATPAGGHAAAPPVAPAGGHAASGSVPASGPPGAAPVAGHVASSGTAGPAAVSHKRRLADHDETRR
ncbi:hypothetical protein DFH06DRAFT_1466898 [Mycena polygramma]|nr:hypothetical protein DFH06DRAFT_1466898 [Mycena polygramma]